MLLGTAHLMAADKTNSPLLTVKRIFDSGEFGGNGFSARWLQDSSGHTTWGPSYQLALLQMMQSGHFRAPLLALCEFKKNLH